jgi:hypothetical protein
MNIEAQNVQPGERDLQQDCLERLQSLKNVSVSHEVPLLGRFVDLVYIKDGRVVTVEFKLRDWRRAIAQAKDHLLGADYAYVCMPERKISDKLRKELKKAGVGLIFYRKGTTWPFDEVIGAPRSQETWSVARALLVDYVNGIGFDYE